MKSLLLLMVIGAGLSSGQAPAFSLSLSANGVSEVKIRQGWPLIAECLVVYEQEEEATLAMKEGAWTGALLLRLSDAADNAVEKEWRQLGATGEPLRFTGEATEAAAVIGLSPETTSELPPGDYFLQATLDTTGGAAENAWSGKLVSQRIRIRVVSLDEEPADADRLLGRRLKSRWLQLEGALEEALAEINVALEIDSESLDTLIDKADLLLEMDRKQESAEVVETALSLFRKKNPKATHPPRELLKRRAQLEGV